MSNNNLHILGAGGHCQSMISCFSKQIAFQGIFDDTYDSQKEEFVLGLPIVNKTQSISESVRIVLAIGNNKIRTNRYKELEEFIEKESLIHNSSQVSEFCTLGFSNQVFPNVFVNGGVVIGNNNILNTGCIIEHGAIIGSNNHISIGSVLAGNVSVGDFVFIGANATVIENIRITDNVVIGAGSVVTRDVLESGTYVGNPLRKIK